jgi:hypothetical protein
MEEQVPFFQTRFFKGRTPPDLFYDDPGAGGRNARSRGWKWGGGDPEP